MTEEIKKPKPEKRIRGGDFASMGVNVFTAIGLALGLNTKLAGLEAKLDAQVLRQDAKSDAVLQRVSAVEVKLDSWARTSDELGRRIHDLERERAEDRSELARLRRELLDRRSNEGGPR